MGCEWWQWGRNGGLLSPTPPFWSFVWSGSPCWVAGAELGEHGCCCARACLPRASITALIHCWSELRKSELGALYFQMNVFNLSLIICLAIVLITITWYFLIITAGIVWSCGFILLPTEFRGKSPLSMAGASLSPLQLQIVSITLQGVYQGAQRSC